MQVQHPMLIVLPKTKEQRLEEIEKIMLSCEHKPKRQRYKKWLGAQKKLLEKR